MGTTWVCNHGFNFWIAEQLDALSSVYKISMVQTHRTRFDNATRFFDFHWPITLILVWIFQIFRSAITFWVIWSTYLSKFVLVGCFMNFQLLAVYMKSKNLTLYYYYFYYLSISIHGNLVNPYWKLALGRVRCWEIHSDIFSIFPYLY
jgi:hypothetical protein